MELSLGVNKEGTVAHFRGQLSNLRLRRKVENTSRQVLVELHQSQADSQYAVRDRVYVPLPMRFHGVLIAGSGYGYILVQHFERSSSW